MREREIPIFFALKRRKASLELPNVKIMTMSRKSLNLWSKGRRVSLTGGAPSFLSVWFPFPNEDESEKAEEGGNGG